MLKPKTYPILQQAIEEGVLHGYNRAHKHVEKPDEILLVESIVKYTMEAIFEWFDIEDANQAS
ncbi:MAG: hypothetical protein ACO24P_00160 [Candidatus Nanopelagicaceae bacterium]